MKKILIAILLVFAILPATVRADESVAAATAYEMREMSEARRVELIENLKKSLPKPDDLKTDGVPMDIRAAMVVVEGLSNVAEIVYANLLEIMIWLIFVFFAFWFGIESWAILRGKAQIKDQVRKMVKKSIIILIAVFVLRSNPASWFMFIMGGVSSIGNFAADLFLSSATSVGIAQTCGQVYGYVIQNADKIGFLGPENIAHVLCITGRISEFFYNGLFESFKYIGIGVGTNAAVAAMGLAGVVLFVWCIFKFTYMTLGVIVDIVLMLMFLPFVAFKESFKDGWSKDSAPMVGVVIEKIANAFGGEDISGQIKKFIQVVIFIIAIALVSSICYLLMQGIVQESSESFIYMMLGAALCAYMISQTEKIAEMMGGAVDKEWSGKIKANFDALVKGVQKYGKNFYELGKKIVTS